MSIPHNAKRVDSRYIVFVPTEEEKQIATMKEENEDMKKRLNKLESLLLNFMEEHNE